VFLVALSTACIGGTNPVADEAVALSPTSAAPTVDPALDRAPLTRGLPRYATNYFRWTRLNAVPLRRAAIPHGEAKRVYVNRSREVVTSLNRRGGDYPDGTVVVKTGAEDGDRASIVAIMRKVAGADPTRGDWQYPEFERKAPGGSLHPPWRRPAMLDMPCRRRGSRLGIYRARSAHGARLLRSCR
jgi:hypothetical protein